jgi:D-ribose pyranose/furanose isomerase RbsD
MSYLQQLHEAHKARQARLWPKQKEILDTERLQQQIKLLRDMLQDRDTTIGSLRDRLALIETNRSIELKRRKFHWRKSWQMMAHLAQWVNVSDKKSIIQAAKHEQEKAARERKLVMLSVGQIAEQVARKYGISETELTGDRRDHGVIQARYEAYYRCANETPLSLPSIGRLLGGKHHTSVLHGRDEYENWMKAKAAGLPIPTTNKKIDVALILDLEPAK